MDTGSVDVSVGTIRPVAAVMLGAFVITFVATRVITRMIRTGRGPFRDTTVGGVHVHHQVYGIFLLLGTGALEFTYRPGSPWVQVLAALFGIGAALTLDEFALWLRLDDVYWGAEGRRSVDAVLVAVIIGTLLVLGTSPYGQDAEQGWGVLGPVIVIDVVAAVVAILKGRIVLGILGVLVPLLALIAAFRLARPRSPWARRFYRPGTRRRRRSERRFPPRPRTWWDPIVDLFAGAPAPAVAEPTGSEQAVSPRSDAP